MSAWQETGFDRTFVYVMLSGMLIDRATKFGADALLNGQPMVPVIQGFIDLHYVRNTGGMFGLLDPLSPLWRVLALRIVPALLALALAVAYVRTPVSQRLLRGALVFMLTGTVANLIDRFKHDGVIDFINLRFGDHSDWLTINVADLYIVVGVALLAWHLSIASSSLPSEKP
jgi:signal peptidase II